MKANQLLSEVVAELKKAGNPTIKKTLMRHGAREPFFGVKVEDLKKIQKRVKTNQELALALYDTGISDAMYLAGLIADDAQMSKKDLQHWVDGAYWYMLSEYTVAWVAAGSRHGREMARKWIKSRKEHVAAAGWATWSNLVSITEDDALDLTELRQLLLQVQDTIHDQPNRVRHTMNGFIIAVGGYVRALTSMAEEVAARIGKVTVDMGDTACKVPDAATYIQKMKSRGTLGKKRKSAKC